MALGEWEIQNIGTDFDVSEKQDKTLICRMIFLIFYAISKGSFHLQLLQNIGYISHVVQYILWPILP